MGQKSQRRKLRKLIEEDDFPKFKSYVRKHRVDVNGMRFTGGDTLLHLACQKGLDHLVWYLLKKGADPLLQNDRDQVALHLACIYALNESHYAYYDLVQPLVEKSQRALNVADKKGTTPRRLVADIKTKLAAKGGKVSESVSASESDAESWSDKLAKEVEDEYTEQWGNYESDFRDHHDYEDGETWDQWASRIGEEVSHKRRQQYQRDHPQVKKKQKTEEEKHHQEEAQAEFQRKLEKEHAEYMRRATRGRLDRLIVTKQRYESRCTDVFQGNLSDPETLGYTDIPWPTPANWNKEVDSMREFLLCDLGEGDSEAVKKYLREQKVRWHPDRFMQRCGVRLKEKEKDRILEKVKLVSQILNKLTEKDS